LIGLSFFIFVSSVVFGGQGTATLCGNGSRGVWKHGAGDIWFLLQTFGCLAGIFLLLGAVCASRLDKPSDIEAIQKCLTNQIIINREWFLQFNRNQLSLESQLQINDQQFQAIVDCFRRQSQVNQKLSDAQGTNRQDVKVIVRQINQQLRSVIRALEKQSLVNRQLSTMLESNLQSEKVRSPLTSQQLSPPVQAIENRPMYIKALFLKYTEHQVTNQP